jgi:D-3-phosphoglycerate dehydrogenase
VEAVKDADGIVVEFFQITNDVIEKLDKTRIIALQAIGYSNVDIKAATEHGIAVTNSPGFCTPEVAVHTVGLMIDVVRKLTMLDRSVRAGSWNPLLGGMPERLAGQTVGLVFFGSIPQYMIPILKAMEMNVICWAPTKTAEYLSQFGVEKVETLDELLRSSDFVSMHCPLVTESKPGRPATYHMMGEAQFKQMKPTAYFINTARGMVVDEPALVKALRENWIKGAAVDVIEDEANETSELFELENCVITPHAAFVSKQAFEDARIISLRQLVELLHGGKIPANLVNRDVAGKLKK